jgi:small subunit ribosomal protein S8
MSIVDPISDMLTRIRNAYAVGKESVACDYSNVKASVCAILAEKGYVAGCAKDNNKLVIELKYDGTTPAASLIERVSKPGRRIYVKSEEIPTVLSGHGIAVVSTSKGMMTGDSAKKQKLGGELICKVY